MAGYVKGEDYAFEAWDGNRNKCIGEKCAINNINIQNIVWYEEDTWIIGET